jgi:hypothetical protein
MTFRMELKSVRIMGSVPVVQIDVASWEAGLTGQLDVKDAPTMTENSAVTKYKIVTVLVSGLLTSL